jgi:hypothetical protein
MNGCTSVEARGGGYLFEEGGAGQVGDIVGDLKVAVCACALGVDDTLGDALSVKVSEEIDVVKVLKTGYESRGGIMGKERGAHPGEGEGRCVQAWRRHRAQ